MGFEVERASPKRFNLSEEESVLSMSLSLSLSLIFELTTTT